MNILIISKPYIESFKEDKGIIYLDVNYKFKKCGFIEISKEKECVTFQFACGWNHIGKGFSNLSDIDFEYKNQSLTMIHKETKKKIFNIQCEQEIFNKITLLLYVSGESFKD
jgi:hypothetical protein